MAQIFGILIPLLVIALSSYIIWRSTNGFEMAADYLGRNMSMGIKGATINAIASSMPEFLATMFFLFYISDVGQFSDSFSGGIGITAGSAVFNLVIIPVAILFYFKFSGKYVRIPVDNSLMKRDGLFLLAANVLMLILIGKQMLGPLDGLILLGFYLFYILFLRSSMKKNPVVSEYRQPETQHKGKFEAIIKLDLQSWIIGGRQIRPTLAWLLLLLSVVIMSLGTWMLVEGTSKLGEEEYYLFGMEKPFKGLNFPLIFASVLLSAAASSIPDTMISIRDSKKGNYDDSISNALGSNIFDISFALGLPLLLYTLINGPLEMSEMVRMWSVSIWLILLLINIVVITVFLSVKKLDWKAGLFLLLVYILFVIFVIEGSIHHEFITRITRAFIR